MKSPCLNYYGPGEPCKLADKDKKNDRCLKCERRKVYNEHNSRNPFPTVQVISKRKDDPMDEKKPVDKPDIELKVCGNPNCAWGTEPISVDYFDINQASKLPFKYCRICKPIMDSEKIAKEFGTTLEAIRGKYLKAAGSPISMAAQEIIETLDKQGLKAKKIGEILDLSTTAIYKRLKPLKSPKKIKPKIPLPASTKDPEDYKITLDFIDHQDVHESLLALAKDRLRDPDQMALFILIKMFEKGLKLNENFDN